MVKRLDLTRGQAVKAMRKAALEGAKILQKSVIASLKSVSTGRTGKKTSGVKYRIYKKGNGFTVDIFRPFNIRRKNGYINKDFKLLYVERGGRARKRDGVRVSHPFFDRGVQAKLEDAKQAYQDGIITYINKQVQV